jgi:RNA polymerase sigma factor (sigma-70 family)
MKKRAQRPDVTGERSAAPAGLTALALEQFSPGLYRFLLRRLRNADKAQDILQEVYLRLLRATETGHVKSPQAYVYRVALNVLCEFQMRERGSEVTFDSDAVARLAEQLADEAVPEAIYEQDTQEIRFEQAIRELPPMQRAVLRLVTQHAFSHADIAQKLGISVSTVRNHLYKAIDYCRHRVADDDAK